MLNNSSIDNDILSVTVINDYSATYSDAYATAFNAMGKSKAIEVRRSFSGGELFSLLLLGIALLISLLLAMGIGMHLWKSCGFGDFCSLLQSD